MPRSSAAKSEFDALLASNEIWLSWIEGASAFQSLVSKYIRWEALAGQDEINIKARLRISKPDNRLLLNSYYVTMVAGFEAYLKASLRELAQVRNLAKMKDYESMGRKLVHMNIRETAKLLKRLDSPPDYLNCNERDLCLSIGSSVPKSVSVILNEDSFAEIESPIKLDSFLERIAVFGYELTWKDLAKVQSIKDAVTPPVPAPAPAAHGGAAKSGTTKALGTGAVETLLIESFVAISKCRNRIAHLGGTAADVSGQVFVTHRKILSAVADEISTKLCA